MPAMRMKFDGIKIRIDFLVFQSIVNVKGDTPDRESQVCSMSIGADTSCGRVDDHRCGVEIAILRHLLHKREQQQWFRNAREIKEAMGENST